MLIAPRTELDRHLDGTLAVLATEPATIHDATSSRPAAGPGSSTGARLSEIAGLVDDRDRLMGRVARLLVAVLEADDLADVTDGMSLHVWVQHVARATHDEARTLLATAETLRDLPAVSGGLADGWLSWSQAVAICKAARTVRVADRSALDTLVADAMLRHRGWEPDALVADVWQWADQLQPSRLEKAEVAADRDQFLTMSPRLFGGGSVYGEFGPVGFATLAEALDAPLGPPAAVPDDHDDEHAVEEAFDQLDTQRRRLTRHHGRRLADRLLTLCENELAGAGRPDAVSGTDPTGTPDGASAPGRDRDNVPRPLLLATIDLEALLDADRAPGWLLHTLAGGRMKVATSTLQRLVDARGADVRTIVLDDTGQVVGVGRRTRVARGWLRQAIWARDTQVRDPDGSTPVRRADLDHRIPWPHGPTDVANLHPLGRAWHNHKTSRSWTVHRARDGATVWRHRRHGWTLRLAPPRRDLTDTPDPGPPRLPVDDLQPT